MTRYKSIDPTGATRATVNRSECLQSRSAREIYDPFLATRVERKVRRKRDLVGNYLIN